MFLANFFDIAAVPVPLGFMITKLLKIQTYEKLQLQLCLILMDLYILSLWICRLPEKGNCNEGEVSTS